MSKNKFKIYEAGKMMGLPVELQRGWREEVKQLFDEYAYGDVQTISPCDYYNFEKERDFSEHEVKFFDLWLIKNCDLVIVNLDYPDSIGTAIELHEAHDNWKIPVIGFGGENVFVHPWIELSLTKRCKTMKEAVEHIVEFYLPNK
jgi:nucleoside 2-deoxyribosyltransferase